MKKLPLEIIHRIVEIFINRLETESRKSLMSKPYLTTSSYAELGKLRLVSKSVSATASSIYFETLSIHDSDHAASILLDRKPLLHPVRRLRVEQLWDRHSKSLYSQRPPPPVSMPQLTELIQLYGTSLTTLDIAFKDCMMLTEDVIRALRATDPLKSIHFSTPSLGLHPMSLGHEESITLGRCLKPGIECLSLLVDSPLQQFVHYLQGADAPDLSYLSLGRDADEQDDRTEGGISRIVKTLKDTLTVIELTHPDAWDGGWHEDDDDDDDGHNILVFFAPVLDTLEGFFTTGFTRYLQDNIGHKVFSRLRVVGFRASSFDHAGSEEPWLQAPMLSKVRTIVTDLEHTSHVNGVEIMKPGPHLKHIIFNQRNQSIEVLCPELVKGFKSEGVECHVIPSATVAEIMELDYKLNGPLIPL